MFSLNGTFKKSGSVGRWETKKIIGMTHTNFKTRLDTGIRSCHHSPRKVD